MFKRLALKAIQRAGWQAYRNADGVYAFRRDFRLTEDPFQDVRRLYRPVRTVFDVGANIGQTAVRLRRDFPQAQIYSFEPDPASFARLTETTASGMNVRCFPIALGRGRGHAKFHRYRFDETNSLLPKAAGAEEFVADSSFFEETGTTMVDVISIDEFCAEHGITEIDLLKVDTQGYELEVLRGAAGMLSRPIPLIYSEVTFIRYYVGQPLFPQVYQFLYEYGYRLVGLYESGFLTHYYQVGGNALFVHEKYGKRGRQRVFKLGPIVVET